MHFMPASLPGYTEDELNSAPLNNTLVMLYVPRRSAVYAGIIRMMSKYRRWCAERDKLHSDLELLIYYDLRAREDDAGGRGRLRRS